MHPLLEELAGWKRRYGEDPSPLARLLERIAATEFPEPEALIRLHEDLLFLRAYPHCAAIARMCDAMLREFSRRVAALGEVPAQMEEPEVSGIAGTSVTAVFSYEAARQLAGRHGDAIGISWDDCPEPDRFGPLLAAILPAAREEWPVEAHFAAKDWIEGVRKPGQTALRWLLGRLGRLPGPRERRAELYDAAGVMLAWRLGDSPAARTHTRTGPATFFHDAPLLRRSDVRIQNELDAPPLPVEQLAAAEARPLLDLIQDTSAVRYRELHGFNHPDLRSVHRIRPGRGLEILFFGIREEARLPLRAYHAGMFFKNGVPAGYVEVLSFFEQAEVGFNLYYTFREGETAWIYAQILKSCRQMLGVSVFRLDPYQIGHENEEAIGSGAFWFYRKLGFRPVDPEIERLTLCEEARLASRPGARTPASRLRRLAASPMVWEPEGAPRGAWDRFHIGRLAAAGWPASVRRRFAQHQRVRRARGEAEYLRSLQGDEALRRAMLRLGSE